MKTKKSKDNYNVDIDHWSGPSGCHEDCPACAKAAQISRTQNAIEADEVLVYMVTDAVAGIIHAARDLGFTNEEISGRISQAFHHVDAERQLIKTGCCSHCERPFSGVTLS